MFGSCVNTPLVTKDISKLVKTTNLEVLEAVLCVDMLLINKPKSSNVVLLVTHKLKVEQTIRKPF